MKINRLEAHDRLLHLKSNDFDIGKTCQEMIDRRPFGDYPFYIFAHKREIGLDEKLAIFAQGAYLGFDRIPSHRLIWQPRLTKPKPQENSMLFKAYPGFDRIKVIWMIPDRELWDQYKKGNMTENQIVSESIHDFINNPSKLEVPEEDDLSDSVIDSIYREISIQVKSGNREIFDGLTGK